QIVELSPFDEQGRLDRFLLLTAQDQAAEDGGLVRQSRLSGRDPEDLQALRLAVRRGSDDEENGAIRVDEIGEPDRSRVERAAGRREVEWLGMAQRGVAGGGVDDRVLQG